MLNRKPTFPRVLFLQGFFHVLGIGVSTLVMDGFLMGQLFAGQSFAALMVWPFFIFIVGIGVLILINIRPYRRIISLLGHGYLAKGKIIEKYGGHIVYEYKYRGQIYRASENLFWAQWRRFKVGQDITAVINHRSPRQALFYDLYQ